MLRKRLRHGLIALVVLLLGVGTAGLLLLRSAAVEFDQKLRQCYSMVDAVQRFPVLTGMINRTYIVPLGNSESGEMPDRKRFDAVFGEIEQRLFILESSDEERAADEAVERLRTACQDFGDAYKALFASPPKTVEERRVVVQRIVGFNQRIVDLSENVRSLYQDQLFATTNGLAAKSAQSVIYIITLMALGVVIAILIYFHLAREIVDPVVGLSYSIDALKRGNFEFTLPESRSENELSALIPAFNEMAMELRDRRREMDEQLLKTNFQNRAVLRAIPAPVFLLDEDGRIDQQNPAASDLQERLGQKNSVPTNLLKLFQESLRHRRDYLPDDIREAILFRIDEEEHYFLPRIFQIAADRGQGVWWAVLLMDVTRFRWLDEMKTNLLATVSHEIKTPLTGIRMVLHLLLEGRTGSLSGMQQDMVTSARDDCERLLVTLNRLLDLARAESGASQLQLKPVDLQEAIERAARLFASTATQKGCQIEIEAERGLPEVQADAVRLDEVIHNLLSNAIKHSPAEDRVILRLSRKACGNFVRLSVIDHGKGVPDESRGKLFDKFYRVPGQKIEGVGLGLSIAREIVLAHGGRIYLTDSSGGRTEFSVDLPLASDAVA